MELREMLNALSFGLIGGSIFFIVRTMSKNHNAMNHTLWAQMEKITRLEQDVKNAVEHMYIMHQNLVKKHTEDYEEQSRMLTFIQNLNASRQRAVDCRFDETESEIKEVHNLLGLSPGQVEFINKFDVQPEINESEIRDGEV